MAGAHPAPTFPPPPPTHTHTPLSQLSFITSLTFLDECDPRHPSLCLKSLRDRVQGEVQDEEDEEEEESKKKCLGPAWGWFTQPGS